MGAGKTSDITLLQVVKCCAGDTGMDGHKQLALMANSARKSYKQHTEQLVRYNCVYELIKDFNHCKEQFKAAACTGLKRQSCTYLLHIRSEDQIDDLSPQHVPDLDDAVTPQARDAGRR